MILLDTSVWVDHFSRKAKQLDPFLQSGQVLIHPLVIGELACGHFRNRDAVFRELHTLPYAQVGTYAEALEFIDRFNLMGLGIGYIDVHLLLSTALTESARFWTIDRRLHSIADRLDLEYSP